MDRRGFLRLLGMGAAAAVAPTKAYSFLGGILRPRTSWVVDDDFAKLVGDVGGMKQLYTKDYRIEFHNGRLWIISTVFDPNATCTVQFVNATS